MTQQVPGADWQGVEALEAEGGALMNAAWLDVLMLHFLVPAPALQPATPLPLDLFDGWGVVTLVAFRMERLRFEPWPDAPRWVTAPGEHTFLNVRTYVKIADETGIQFLCEFVPKILARLAGPVLYGLPYRRAPIAYRHDMPSRRYRGQIGPRIRFDADYAAAPDETQDGTLDHFVLERYTAFNRWLGRTLRFRVAHPRWRMRRARLREFCDAGLRALFPFWPAAKFAGGHFTPGFEQVDMGRPRLLQS